MVSFALDGEKKSNKQAGCGKHLAGIGRRPKSSRPPLAIQFEATLFQKPNQIGHPVYCLLISKSSFPSPSSQIPHQYHNSTTIN